MTGPDRASGAAAGPGRWPPREAPEAPCRPRARAGRGRGPAPSGGQAGGGCPRRPDRGPRDASPQVGNRGRPPGGARTGVSLSGEPASGANAPIGPPAVAPSWGPGDPAGGSPEAPERGGRGASGGRGPPKARLHPAPADGPPPRPHLTLGSGPPPGEGPVPRRGPRARGPRSGREPRRRGRPVPLAPPPYGVRPLTPPGTGGAWGPRRDAPAPSSQGEGYGRAPRRSPCVLGTTSVVPAFSPSGPRGRPGPLRPAPPPAEGDGPGRRRRRQAPGRTGRIRTRTRSGTPS